MKTFKKYVESVEEDKKDDVEETRNYRKEYDNYHAQPEQRERNAARSRARRLMVKSGKVEKFDKMDVHHKDNDPLNNEKDNLAVTTQTWNRTEPRLRTEGSGLKGSEKKVDERLMSSTQKVVQMQHYWAALDRMASDERKKKNMKSRFGIKNIKLDKRGNIVSFDESDKT
jgi:hypothetical protein